MRFIRSIIILIILIPLVFFILIYAGEKLGFVNPCPEGQVYIGNGQCRGMGVILPTGVK